MTQLQADFKDFLSLLNAHRVEYLLIGGYAVGYHGYPRATVDLDGKWLMGLRVVRESGARIGLGQAFVRQLALVFQVFVFDCVFAVFTEKRQRACELLSKTRVVRADRAGTS